MNRVDVTAATVASPPVLHHSDAATHNERSMPQSENVVSPARPTPRASAESPFMSAAEIDKILLSLSPAQCSAERRASMQNGVSRANSDPTISPRHASAIDTLATDVNELGVVCAASSQKTRRNSGLASVGKRATLDETHNDSFLDVFGLLGISTVLAFIFAGCAVLLQAVVQVYPTRFANVLMKTSNFDDGDFWLIPETDLAPKVVATALLVFCASCYFALALVMLFFRDWIVALGKKTHESSAASARLDLVKPLGIDSQTSPRTRDLSSMKLQVVKQTKKAKFAIGEVYAKFANIDGPYHAYYNVFFDVPKLVFQSLTLVAYLRKGFPTPVIAFYATLLGFNWIVSFYRFQRTAIDRALTISRLFYTYDLFFAVFAPLVVIIYAYDTFRFDYDEFHTREETIPAGIFDRLARLYADPSQMATFRLGFYSLLLKTSSTIFVKCGLLFLSLYKWVKIIVTLIRSNHARQRQLEIPHLTKSAKQSRRHLIVGIVLFICAGILLIVYTIVAVVTSAKNCKSYPNCITVSYQWYASERGCPCAAYINRETAPRRFSEWTDPPDATDELALMAKEGQLKVIQIVNRALPTFPDAMRKSTKLEQIILLYTKTETIPDWAKELKYLEYIHIEGDFSGRSLMYMPFDLFSKMKNLRFIHTGVIPKLATYPSLNGLFKLQYLAIAAPYALRELPNLDDAKSLISFAVVDAHRVPRLPSLRAATNLHRFGLFYRNEMCCNGFMNGPCNLTDSQCISRDSEPAIKCLNDSIPDADLALIKTQTTGSVCLDFGVTLSDSVVTAESSDVTCGGVMYKQCQEGGVPGMCFNSRMQVVTCTVEPYFQAMRRLQIARHVGEACDPDVESWLGCSG